MVGFYYVQFGAKKNSNMSRFRPWRNAQARGRQSYRDCEATETQLCGRERPAARSRARSAAIAARWY